MINNFVLQCNYWDICNDDQNHLYIYYTYNNDDYLYVHFYHIFGNMINLIYDTCLISLSLKLMGPLDLSLLGLCNHMLSLSAICSGNLKVPIEQHDRCHLGLVLRIYCVGSIGWWTISAWSPASMKMVLNKHLCVNMLLLSFCEVRFCVCNSRYQLSYGIAAFQATA